MNKSLKDIHENTHKNYQYIEISENVEECCTQTQNIISLQNLMELHKIDYMLELKVCTNRNKKFDSISLILAAITRYNFISIISIITPTTKIKIKFSNLWNWATLYLMKMAQLKKQTLEFNENKSTTYLDLWGTMKEVLRSKIIVLIFYIKNKKIY